MLFSGALNHIWANLQRILALTTARPGSDHLRGACICLIVAGCYVGIKAYKSKQISLFCCIVPLPNSYVEALTLSMTEFQNSAFKGLKLNDVTCMGS